MTLVMSKVADPGIVVIFKATVLKIIITAISKCVLYFCISLDDTLVL